MRLKAIFVASLISLSSLALAQSAPTGKTFHYADGGSATYYQFQLNQEQNKSSDTYIFFYGGTGCVDFKPYIPKFFSGLDQNSTIFALNKRKVEEGSSPNTCSPEFAKFDLPHQWFSDYMEFITEELGRAKIKPKNVAIVGISEGAYPAVKVARSRSDITNLIIIGDGGGWTMRKSLEKLTSPSYVQDGWMTIATDANSTSRTWLGRPYRWWFDIMDIDSLPDYLSLNIPILMGHGELDQGVPVESAIALQKAFLAAGKSNLKLHIYKGADHTLTSGQASNRESLFAELSKSLKH